MLAVHQELELFRRPVASAFRLRPTVRADLVVQHVERHRVEVDPLLRVRGGPRARARSFGQELQALAGGLVERPARSQIRAGQIELRVEAELALRDALDLRDQRHRSARRLGHRLGQDELHRSEVDPRL